MKLLQVVSGGKTVERIYLQLQSWGWWVGGGPSDFIVNQSPNLWI